MSPVSSWGVSPRHTVSLNPGTFKANGSCRHKWPGDFGETIHVASWKQWKSEIGAKVPSLWPSALPKLVKLQKFGVKGCESVWVQSSHLHHVRSCKLRAGSPENGGTRRVCWLDSTWQFFMAIWHFGRCSVSDSAHRVDKIENMMKLANTHRIKQKGRPQ